MTPAVHFDCVGAIGRITFDQPGVKANTLSRAVWSELGQAVSTAACRSDLRGLVLTGGKDGMFLAGADLRELYALPTDDSQPTASLLKAGLDVLSLLEGLGVPTLAAIDGACLGGGLEVALACDYRLAGTHPKVKIGLPEVKLGLIPGWGGTQRLTRVVGFEPGVDLLLTGRALSGPDAEAVGLVDGVVPSAELWEVAVHRLTEVLPEDWSARRKIKREPISVRLAESLADKIPKLPAEDQAAAQVALRVAEHGAKRPLADALALETDAFLPLLAGPDARQRIEAFLKK